MSFKKGILVVVFIVIAILMIACLSVLEGIHAGLTGVEQGLQGSQAQSGGSSSTQQQIEWIVTVTGYNEQSIMMTGQWIIRAPNQSAAVTEGRRRFLAEIPNATHVNAMALRAP